MIVAIRTRRPLVAAYPLGKQMALDGRM